MQGNPSFRYRITFAKTEAMRYTGHLDLHRAWERTFRRAGLPLAYSQGFHPHPRLHLAAALPLGVLGEAELLDAWLEEAVDPAAVVQRLRAAAPPGIEPKTIERVGYSEPTLQPRVESAVFLAELVDRIAAQDLKQRVERLLSLPQLERQRRGKVYDLRPLLRHLEAAPDGSWLKMELLAREGATGRPEEVMDALGLAPSSALTTRTQLLLAPLEPA